MPTDPTTLPGWKWMPGMLAPSPDCPGLWLRILAVDDGVPSMWADNRYIYTSFDVPWSDYADGGWTPDPTDPATAGCLLALLGDEAWRVRAQKGGQWLADGERWTCHPTLGAACMAVAESLGRWPGGAP